jgi:hypothetical protein
MLMLIRKGYRDSLPRPGNKSLSCTDSMVTRYCHEPEEHDVTLPHILNARLRNNDGSNIKGTAWITPELDHDEVPHRHIYIMRQELGQRTVIDENKIVSVDRQTKETMQSQVVANLGNSCCLFRS